MPSTPQEKKRALTRTRRIRGQLEALERALDSGAECAPVLQQIAAIRGAVNGLMSQVLESHIREELGDRDGTAAPGPRRDERIDEVVGLLRSYLT